MCFFCSIGGLPVDFSLQNSRSDRNAELQSGVDQVTCEQSFCLNASVYQFPAAPPSPQLSPHCAPAHRERGKNRWINRTRRQLADSLRLLLEFTAARHAGKAVQLGPFGFLVRRFNWSCFIIWWKTNSAVEHKRKSPGAPESPPVLWGSLTCLLLVSAKPERRHWWSHETSGGKDAVHNWV